MTREKAIEVLENRISQCQYVYDTSQFPDISYPGAKREIDALEIALSALRPVSREQADVVIKSLKLRLENNEEGGVVYIPKFAVMEMIERLEAIKNG